MTQDVRLDAVALASAAARPAASGRWRTRGRRLLFWARRYLPAEIVGTATLFLASWAAMALGGSPIVVAYAAALGESLGFYAVLGTGIHRELRRTLHGRSAGARLRRTIVLLVAECGPAELLDSLLARPLLLLLSMAVLPDGWSLLVGKIAADLLFYVISAACYTLTVAFGLRGSTREGRGSTREGHEKAGRG